MAGQRGGRARAVALGVVGLALLPAAPAAAAPVGAARAPGHFTVDTTPEDVRVTPAPATCDVALRFAGYAEDRRATVTFSVKAPQHAGRTVTQGGELEVSDDSGVLRRRDRDAVLVWTAADLDLSGARPHPDRGYRVTVAVDVLGDPQGRRVEQFWLQPCSTGEAPPGDGWDWSWDSGSTSGWDSGSTSGWGGSGGSLGTT